MAIEIVDFPMKNGGSFHSLLYVYQRVNMVYPTHPILKQGCWTNLVLRVEFGSGNPSIHQNLEKWVDQLPVMVENLREDETPND